MTQISKKVSQKSKFKDIPDLLQDDLDNLVTSKYKKRKTEFIPTINDMEEDTDDLFIPELEEDEDIEAEVYDDETPILEEPESNEEAVIDQAELNKIIQKQVQAALAAQKPAKPKKIDKDALFFTIENEITKELKAQKSKIEKDKSHIHKNIQTMFQNMRAMEKQLLNLEKQMLNIDKEMKHTQSNILKSIKTKVTKILD